MYSKALDAALIAGIAYHLAISPYTKVEESFNIQAIHDILNYGVYPHSAVIENYDHIEFPGVVPRTFVGSLLISGIVNLVQKVTLLFGVNLLENQDNLLIVVRAVLGLANGISLIRLKNAINKVTFKKNNVKGLIGTWFLVLLLTQFHLLYYASRTLPNFIALPFVLYSFSKLIQGDLSGLTWLAFVGVIFRVEIGVLVGIIAFVSSLVFGQTNFFNNLIFLAAGTILGIFVTVSVDSYFWNGFIIPELASFQFNIIHGKSVEWGVEPWSAYFLDYLPRIFSPPIVLLLCLPGFLTDPADDGTDIEIKKGVAVVTHPARNSLRILFISSILFIAALSFQPHKEWRFIVYTFPIFLLQGANGLANISLKWSVGFFNKVLVLIIILGIVISSATSLFMGFASSFNYPGGEALVFVNSYIESYKPGQNVTVHMDVAPCMTGINRFGELHNSFVTYDKTEKELDLLKIWNSIDIAITDHKIARKSDETIYQHKNWKLLHVSRTFTGVTVKPIVALVDDSYGSQLALKVVREILVGKVNSLVGFLNSLIMTEDFLYVYLRTAKDKGLDALIKKRIDTQKEYLRAEEEVLLGLKDAAVTEVDGSIVKEAVNSEIDDLEKSL